VDEFLLQLLAIATQQLKPIIAGNLNFLLLRVLHPPAL
jgi:hypothetical protein